MTDRVLEICPNKKQEEFFLAGGRYVAYGGARGGGKSWAMRMKLVLLAFSHDGISILLLRRTLGELRENHILPLRKLLFGIAEYKDTTKEFLFPNGSRIKLGYCDSEGDVLQYQGQAYEVIGLEEATHFTYYQFLCLTESNRVSGNMKESFSPRMYLTCNPGGVGHDWVKRLFVDRCYEGNEKAENYVFIRSSIYDNDFLLRENPEYLENLLALPELRRRAMLDGDWNCFEGAYFPEFKFDVHTCEPFEIPREWGRFCAMDYGLDMTCCLWVACSPEGILYVYRELHEKNLILSEAAKRICSMNLGGERIRYITASPDLWNRRQDSGKSGAEIMRANGLSKLIKADNRRIIGWRYLREYLNEGNGNVKLKIFRNCVNLIRCLPLLRFDELIPEDCASTPHEITHAPEALRYAVMSREPNYFVKVKDELDKYFPFRKRESIRDYIDY